MLFKEIMKEDMEMVENLPQAQNSTNESVENSDVLSNQLLNEPSDDLDLTLFSNPIKFDYDLDGESLW